MSQALLKSSYRGDLNQVIKLINERHAIEYVDHKGRTPLICAARMGHLNVVKYLLEKGANVNAKTIYHNTPLIYAAKHGHLLVVKLLAEFGADLNVRNMTQLEMDSSTEGEHASDENALIVAVARHHLPVVRWLLEQGMDVNIRNSFGTTPLGFAAMMGYEDMIRLLLSYDATVNHVDQYEGSPLAYAALNNHYEAARLLIQAGADINLHGEGQNTPLSIALQYGYFDVAKLLIEKDAHMCELNLIFEIEDNVVSPEVWDASIGLLIQEGHAIESYEEEHAEALALCGTPFSNLMANNNIDEAALLLIDHPEWLNEVNGYGQTPLMRAIVNGSVDAVKWLLDRNADYSTVSNRGYTALYFAVRYYLYYKNHDDQTATLYIDIIKALEACNVQIDESTVLLLHAKDTSLDEILCPEGAFVLK